MPFVPFAPVSPVSLSQPSAVTARAAWDLLLQGKHPEAKAAFVAVRQKSPTDIEAARGLGLLQHLEENESASVTSLLPVFLNAPGSWQAVALWQPFLDMCHRQARHDVLMKAALSVRQSKAASVPQRASALHTIGDLHHREGRLVEAQKAWDELGYVRKWHTLGSFDNVSRSGYAKAFPPELGMSAGDQVTGKNRLSIRWQPQAIVTPEGYVSVATSLGNNKDNVFYATTAVFAEAERDVVIRYTADGATKLWLNGLLVAEDPIYRSSQICLTDTLSVSVHLNKGWNTVLLKLADDEKHSAHFQLRFTLPGGEERGLALQADPTKAVLGAVKAPATPLLPLQPASIQALRATALAANPEAQTWLGFQLNESDDHEQALAVLKHAVELAPKSAWTRWQLALALNADERRDEARTERDAARQVCKFLAGAEAAAAGETLRGKPLGEQVATWKSLATRFPASARIPWQLVALHEKAKSPDSALAAAKQAVALSGEGDALASYSRWLAHFDRDAEAARVLAQALLRYPTNSDLLEFQTERTSEAGKTAEAVAAYTKRIQSDPTDQSDYTSLAKLYQGAGNLTKAADVLTRARRGWPNDSDIAAELGELEKQRGNKPQAIALLKEAIRLDPSAVQLRDKLQTLSGAQPVIALAAATPTAPLIAKRPKVGELAGVSTVTLLDEGRCVVYPDGAALHYQHNIITVLDEAAAKRYQSYGLQYWTNSSRPTVEISRIIKPDGKSVDMREHLAQGYAQFPSLEAGDTIEILQRVEDFPDGGLAGKFWRNWYFSSQGADVRLSRYVLVTPKAMTIQTKLHGGELTPVVQERGEWKIQEWKATDLRAPKPEAFSPGSTDSGLWLDISSFGSWKEIIDWYRDLSGPLCLPEAVIKAKAEELTKGKTTEREKLLALVRFVSDKIQYQSGAFRMSAFIPTEGKKVLRETYGDCKDKAALLTAMLAHVGIKSRMVLLSGRDDGLTPYLPSPRFNHAIAVVETENGPMFIDGTANRLAFGSLPQADQGVSCLIIGEDQTQLSLIPLLPVEQEGLTDTHVISLAPDGKLTGSLELDTFGSSAGGLRNGFLAIPESSRDEAVKRTMAQFVERMQVEKSALIRLNETESSAGLSCTYSVDRYAQGAGNFLLVPLPWNKTSPLSRAATALTEPSRTQDIEFASYRGTYKSTVRLTLPPGYSLQEARPTVTEESPFGRFTLTFKQEGSTLTAERSVVITATRIPVAQAAAFRAFIEKLEKEGQTPLVLKRN
ncbi:DUF3857 domain-containing protein [Armatimonas sp.]|uniref:DUF3857 domain-containing protein n=1 Tax=Armatimonas sp. TaxID=1872638 RepID=UPI00286C4D80|nr:DUF3857 domain-containing protein [Armatimonas sp.]